MITTVVGQCASCSFSAMFDVFDDVAAMVPPQFSYFARFARDARKGVFWLEFLS
jgi:hypothetical protein